MADRCFDPTLFKFLRDLKAHNSTEWFQANKQRFEDEVRTPLLGFILAFAEPLAGISRQFEANPARSGGSMFRLNRDTRFALDKSPYKTNVGAQFRHRACPKDVHSPGFYLHLEPRGCFASAGLWHPDKDTLQKVSDEAFEILNILQFQDITRQKIEKVVILLKQFQGGLNRLLSIFNIGSTALVGDGFNERKVATQDHIFETSLEADSRKDSVDDIIAQFKKSGN